MIICANLAIRRRDHNSALTTTCIGLVFIVLADSHVSGADDAFVPLFADGKLTGWVEEQHDFYEAEHPDTTTWSVADGIIRCDASTGNCGFLRYDRLLGDFELRLEYRHVKGCNSGIGFRSPKPYDGTPWTLPLRIGYELQIIDDAGGKPTARSTGSLYSVLPAEVSAARPAGEWNQLILHCRGPQIHITLNDKVVQDIDQTQYEGIRDRATKGYLSLQNHGGDIEFRNIRLKE